MAGGGLYSSSTGGAVARPAVAEFVGTFVLVFAGCSVAVATALHRALAGSAYNSLAVALAFGLALTAVVAAIGHVSGGHVNPAVTIGQASVGLFPWRHVPVYVIAQLLGAIVAALAVWVCFGGAVRDGAHLGAPAVAGGVSVMRGLLTETLITFILVFVVGLVAGDPRVPSARIASIAVGFALACGVFIGGPLTGGGVNPARALGPMIVSGQLDDWWIYIVGPLVGGVIAAVVALYVLRAFQMEQDDEDEGEDDDGERRRRENSVGATSSRLQDGETARAR
jgi:MIP family channel proteins